MRAFYPEIEPYRQFRLDVGDGHELQVEECGNPAGLPVVFLHGGPGGGCEVNDRRFFDPQAYRIVLFDQRGAGRSTPFAGLEANTTPHLVADIERIRRELGIDRWLVFGGSWGSTLALSYAETHPGRVLGLVLRGIFLCTPAEMEWFYQTGTPWLYPDYYEDFIAPIPEAERDDLLHAYHRRLTGGDEAVRNACARAWSLYEGLCSTLVPDEAKARAFADPAKALPLARIETHYFVNRIFQRPGQLLEEAHRLRGIPGVIVHGRYDVICPLANAWELQRRWPEAELQIIPDAGHASGEPGIRSALLDATDAMLRRLA